MKKRGRILFLYWLLYYVLISFIESGPQQKYFEAFTSNFISLPLKVTFVILVTEYLTPLFLKKRIVLFAVVYFTALVAFAILLRITDNAVILEYILTDWVKEPLFSPAPFLYSAIKLQFVTSIPFVLALTSHHLQVEQANAILHQQRSEAELSFLRAQFHPHFLFNSLNTLYASIELNPREASSILLKISSLLRFSLYEARQARLSLNKEIDYLKDYIDLQKKRFDNIQVSFSIFGDPNDKKIEPLLILSCVENSFKHCQPDSAGQLWITVQINVDGEWLSVQVDNSITPGIEAEVDNGQGLGISALKRRLELLYPGNHVAKFERDEENFYAYLKFPLMP